MSTRSKRNRNANRAIQVAPNTAVSTTQNTQPTGQRSILDIIAGAANNPNVDAVKMQALLSMQKEIMAIEAEKSFNMSLASLQAEMPLIPKNGKVDFTSAKGRTNYDYERYEDIDALIRPLTSKYGFSFSCIETEQPGRYVGTLLHKDGHSKSGYCTLPPDKTGNKNDIQAIGSSSSYARRIILKGMLNIVTTGEDDNGNGTSVVSDEQFAVLENLIEESKTDINALLTHFGAESLSKLQKRDYEAAVAILKQKIIRKK